MGFHSSQAGARNPYGKWFIEWNEMWGKRALEECRPRITSFLAHETIAEGHKLLVGKMVAKYAFEAIKRLN
jgi:hypothetical protein